MRARWYRAAPCVRRRDVAQLQPRGGSRAAAGWPGPVIPRGSVETASERSSLFLCPHDGNGRARMIDRSELSRRFGEDDDENLDPEEEFRRARADIARRARSALRVTRVLPI